MSLDALFAHMTRESPSAPLGERFIPPRLLAVCSLCGLIRDETGSPPALARWVTQRAYRKTHHVNPNDFPLTHTYCPECLMKVQDTVRRYFLEMEA